MIALRLPQPSVPVYTTKQPTTVFQLAGVLSPQSMLPRQVQLLPPSTSPPTSSVSAPTVPPRLISKNHHNYSISPLGSQYHTAHSKPSKGSGSTTTKANTNNFNNITSAIGNSKSSGEGTAAKESLGHLSREERRRRRRATQKYRTAHATRERIRVEAFNVAFSDPAQASAHLTA